MQNAGGIMDKLDSSVIVVRRYTCFEKTSWTRKRTIKHEGILNICGLPPNSTVLLAQELRVLKYKLACNCDQCISFVENVKSAGLLTEPLMKGVSIAFNFLTNFGYKLQCSTAVQNPDGSNSTSWVWVKSQKTSDL